MPDALNAKESLYSRIVKVLYYLFIGYLCVQLLNYLSYAMNMVLFPYDVDVGEGLIVSRAFIIAQGKNIYSPIESEPYFVMNYTPLFEFLMAGFVKIFGPNIILGRVISICSALCSGYIIYKIVNGLTKLRQPAVIAGLMFFTSGWLTSWSVLCRVDVFALMLTLLGISLILGTDNRFDKRYILLSVMCFTGAVFTRQSMIAGPLSVIIMYIIEIRNTANKNQAVKSLKLFLTGLIGLCLSITLLLLCLTKGEFYRHTFVYTMSVFEFENFIRWMSDFLMTHGGVIVLALIYLFKQLFRRDIGIVLSFWLISLLITITAGKLGSSINYFLEFWAASCILVGILLADLHKQENFRYRGFLTGLVLILLAGQLYLFHDKVDFTTPADEYRQSSERLSRMVGEAKGEVLSEYTGYLLQNNKKSIYQPFSMAQLSLDGRWDQSKLIEDIQNKKFGLIIMSGVGMEYDRWTPQVKAAVDSYYKRVLLLPCFELSFYHHSINTYFIFEPKDEGEE